MKMNREIKFRVWDNLDKKMYYPDAIASNDYGILVPIYIKEDGLFDAIDYETTDNNRFIIMEYTGLKDRDGKEIWEGDLLEINHKCWTAKGIIKFGNGGFYFEEKNNPIENSVMFLSAIEFHKPEYFTYKGFGNIYENPFKS